MPSPLVLYMLESSSRILHGLSLSHYWECRVYRPENVSCHKFQRYLTEVIKLNYLTTQAVFCLSCDISIILSCHWQKAGEASVFRHFHLEKNTKVLLYLPRAVPISQQKDRWRHAVTSWHHTMMSHYIIMSHRRPAFCILALKPENHRHHYFDLVTLTFDVDH